MLFLGPACSSAVEGEFKDSSNKQQASVSAESSSAGRIRATHHDGANEKGLDGSVCVFCVHLCVLCEMKHGALPAQSHPGGLIKHITNTLSVS